MVCVAGEGQGVLEILDQVGGGLGGEEDKKTLKIPQSVRVAELVSRVSSLYKYKIGSVGLILQWNQKKVDLMNVRRDLTIAEIGVDFTSGKAYSLRLLITEWQPSPSLGDEQKMPCEDGGGPSVILEVLDLPTGDFAHTNLEIGPATRVNGLFRLIERNHKPGTFGLFLRCGRNKVKLNDKDTRKLTEVGVDLSSPGTVMLLVTEPADSPTTTPPKEERGRRIQFDSEGFEMLRKKPPSREKRWMTGFDDEAPAKPESERIEEQGHEDVEPNRRSENAYVGLVNQAMTCYLNSLIQALYMTPEFRNALYNWEYLNDREKDEANSIPYQLQKLFLNLQTSSKNAIETTSLTKSFGWDSTEAWQQHDIQELCRVMFDALEQKFKNTEQADLINRLYEGKMIDYVKCLECGTEKSREDTFLDIPLPVKPFGSNVAYNSVEEALNAFVQPETLDDTNQYHCETCNKKCDAHKGLKFTKFPYLLTLHLKRFDFDYNTFHRIKLNDEVTFPDVLNLNSFIPSESEDGPCNEEDAGVAVKCEEAPTVDGVAALDEKSPPSETTVDNGMSASDHSANHDHDDDSGIDLSNGPSTSSCSAHNNHDSEKNRDNRAAPKGPYEYELFSIMIHSGSASGGHYYAYIKDFRTGQWLCFNDQNVSPITYEDIQKTYGGSATRGAYYSGVYSSSTNAYMLMYRQIDPVRNALPMQVKDFPKHLQDMLLKMQDNQDMSCRDNLMAMYRLKVFCHQKGQKTITSGKFLCRHDDTWAEVTRRAHVHLCHETLIPRDRVRLVTYQEDTETIECSFDGREEEPLRSILFDRRTLLLEIREPNETFKTYLPGGVPTKVMVVDPANKEVVKGPIKVRGHAAQTVGDYKIQLGEEIGMDPKDIRLIVQYPNSPDARLLTKDDSTLLYEGLASSEKIFVPTSFDHDSPKDVEYALDEIMEIYGDLITLNIPLPDTSEEALWELNIPSLADKTKKKAAAEVSLTNGPSKPSPTTAATTTTTTAATTAATTTATTVATTTATTATETAATDSEKPPEATAATPNDAAAATKPTAAAPAATNAEERRSVTPVLSVKEFPAFPSEDFWYTPHQSNSEDSSLSYSDRTLVGEDNASEDDDYPLADVEHELFHPTESENWDNVDPVEYYFRATPHPDKMLRVLVDKRMSLGMLKKLLEPFVGVPMEYFKICRQSDGEGEFNRLMVSLNLLKDGETLYLKLGRALRSNEIVVKLYQLLLSLEEPYRYLCEWIVSKDATVGQTKEDILAELRRKFDIHIPYDRCRLRQKSYKTAGKVFLDDQRIKDLGLYWPFEIIVQELQQKEQVTDQNDIAIFARQVWMPPMRLGPYVELVVKRWLTLAEIRPQLSQVSHIPEEHLEMAKGKGSLPGDTLRHSALDWNSQSTPPDNSAEMTLEDGIIVYYRDCREKAHEPSAEEVQDMKSKTKSRMLGISSSSRYSPRRERALKIYIDDK